MTEFATDEALSQRCEEVLEAACEAIAWHRETSNEAVRSKTGTERTLRRAVVQAGKLVDAAKRRTCVGVFGASQAGKSFLISALARKGEERMMAMFGDRAIDFVARINPQGEQESTGVVTRFTCKPQGKLLVGHPVKLGLLSETDVVRILVNSFAFDLSHGGDGDEEENDLEPHRQAINKVMDELASESSGQSPLSIEDTYEIAEYVVKLSKGNKRVPRFEALRGSAYWEEMERRLPTLGVEDRVKFYAVMWENLEIYTIICRELLGVLEKLNHKRDVFTGPDALFKIDGDEWLRSMDKSIVNVATLSGIGTPSGDDDDTVSVVSADGMAAQIERTCLTGLIAELHITIQDKPFDFFDHTDLLDFPGARTRKPVSKDPSLLNDVETRTEHFLRGKVAYLFERYCDEQELNAMILTVGPSNQEVADLAHMVEDWIEKTHGKTPESRNGVAAALFFVFSKFDTSFERGAGKGINVERWNARIEASLLKPFGGGHSMRTNWVNNWTPDKPFSNSYWIRNPNLRNDALFQYEGDDENFREVGFRNADVESFIDAMHKVYLQCKGVKRHFADPDGAWLPCMQFNDGGISRLATALAPVCKPELKRAQVARRLSTLCMEIDEQIARYHISGDIETVRAEKTEIAKNILKSFARSWRAEKLGHLLQALVIDENHAVDGYRAAEREAAATMVQGASTADAVPADNNDLLGALGFDAEEVGPATHTTDGPYNTDALAKKGDIAEKFADYLESFWFNQVSEIAHNDSYTSYLGISSEAMMKFANEIVLLAHRVGIFEDITRTVRAQYQFKITPREAWVWRQVAPACHIFNDFLTHLGVWTDSKRGAVNVTNIQDQPVMAFIPQTPVGEKLTLDDEPTEFGRSFLLDYLNVAQHQFKRNAEFQIGFVGDAVENARLGKILKTLSA